MMQPVSVSRMLTVLVMISIVPPDVLSQTDPEKPARDRFAFVQKHGADLVKDLQSATYLGKIPDDHLAGPEEYLAVPYAIEYVPSRDALFIGDLGNSNIKVYAPSGMLIKTIGRHGQGPGEFNGVVRLLATRDEILWVIERTRIQRITLDGLNLSTYSKLHSIEDICELPGGRIAVSTIQEPAGGGLLLSYSEEGAILSHFGGYDHVLDGLDLGRQTGFYSRYLLESGDDELVAVTSWHATIHIYDFDGNELSSGLIQSPFLREFARTNRKCLERWDKGGTDGEMRIVYLLAGLEPSVDGGFWVMSSTMPYIYIARVETDGKVLEQYLWTYENPLALLESFAVKETDDVRVFFIIDQNEAVVHKVSVPRNRLEYTIVNIEERTIK